MHYDYSATSNEVILDAFGPLTSMVMQRKRLLREIHAASFFRWHDERLRQELLMLEFNIRWYLFEVCDPDMLPIMEEV